MSTTTGTTGAMHCSYCGRPAAALVWIGGLGYHPECTRGPGYQEQTYQPLPPQFYAAPMDEQRVRQIVREELAATRGTT